MEGSFDTSLVFNYYICQIKIYENGRNCDENALQVKMKDIESYLRKKLDEITNKPYQLYEYGIPFRDKDSRENVEKQYLLETNDPKVIQFAIGLVSKNIELKALTFKLPDLTDEMEAYFLQRAVADAEYKANVIANVLKKSKIKILEINDDTNGELSSRLDFLLRSDSHKLWSENAFRDIKYNAIVSFQLE